MRVEIVPPTPAHVHELAHTMRPEDVAELATHDKTPAGALREGVEGSTACWAVLFDGRVCAICGVGPMPDAGIGEAWCLTSSLAAKHKRAFLRASRECLGRMLLAYPALIAGVDARYKAALRWAVWMGFELWPEVKSGPKGALFVPITVTRRTWAS